MAIDSAEKRRSVSGIQSLLPGVTPNAANDAEWRQQSGWCYSGIVLADGVVLVDVGLSYRAELGTAPAYRAELNDGVDYRAELNNGVTYRAKLS